jgi:hypothetical protein
MSVARSEARVQHGQRVTNRERLRAIGIGAGAVVTILTAIRGQIVPAIVFGLATIAVAAAVIYERRSGR